MSSQTSQTYETYTPVYDEVPAAWEDGRVFLTEQLKRISNGLNDREIGFLLDEELLTGQAFIPGVTTGQAFRSVLRMVVVFGPLPNASTKSVPHNVVVDANFSLMNMYLSATDPIDLVGFSLQYYSVATSDIVLSYDVSNIVVTTQSNYSNYTTSYVVFEYIQQL
jgi:hypothetical protein